MTQQNRLTTQGDHHASLTKRMLPGAGIALILIVIFLASAGPADPGWPKFWMIKPLVVVPLAGAAGGAFYHYMDHLGYGRGWNRVLVILLSLVVYLFGLWIGTVLGLKGTMWD